MIIKINNAEEDGNEVYRNTGSCKALVEYLRKEDADKGQAQELFFNHEHSNITAAEVIQNIDKNRQGIGKDECKFYSLVIAPSLEELKHLKSSKRELKKYTRKVMEIYAGNFNRKGGGSKNLSGKDIVYYAKLEDHRYYKGDDEEVKKGTAKQGDPKPEGNIHIHVIVSRKDKLNRTKLSPVVHDKKLFHIEGFKLKGCYHFDAAYNYQGAAKELEAHMQKRTGHTKEIEMYAGHKPDNLTEKEEQKTSKKPTDKGKGINPNRAPDF